DWLASAPAQNPVARQITAVRHLEALGARVHLAVADVADLSAMRPACAEAVAALGPISMVVHAAGLVDDGPLLAKTPEAVEAVLAAKVYGTRVLGQVFPDGSIDHLILLASSSAQIGPAG